MNAHFDEWEEPVTKRGMIRLRIRDRSRTFAVLAVADDPGTELVVWEVEFREDGSPESGPSLDRQDTYIGQGVIMDLIWRIETSDIEEAVRAIVLEDDHASALDSEILGSLALEPRGSTEPRSDYRDDLIAAYEDEVARLRESL